MSKKNGQSKINIYVKYGLIIVITEYCDLETKSTTCQAILWLDGKTAVS